MLAPVGRRDFILNQRVDRLWVGHAQEGLSKAHQRDAFIGGKPVLCEKHLHQSRIGLVANSAHQVCAPGRDARAILSAQRGNVDETVDRFLFIGIGGQIDRTAGVAVIRHGRRPQKVNCTMISRENELIFLN